MMILTNEELEKLGLLDRLFSTLSVEQLKELIERQEIIEKLKGTNQNPVIFTRLFQEHNTCASDLITLQNEVFNLKSDLHVLIRAINSVVFTAPYSQDFHALKNKHGIY